MAGAGSTGGSGSSSGLQRANSEAQFTRFRDDFLRHELLPNVDLARHRRRVRRLVTNSMGMADKEYSLTPPAKTWRIALIGDSVSQGAGTDFGTNYEARLEEHLNQRFAGRGHDRYEILNFAVQGYQLTQLVDVGTVSRAAVLLPTSTSLALTERSVFTRVGGSPGVAGPERRGPEVRLSEESRAGRGDHGQPVRAR